MGGPFYLRAKVKFSADSSWYYNVPVGHNTLGNTVKRLCKQAGIEGNKTNHSLRATTATRGLEIGIPDKLLMECTGHRSLASLHNYQRPSEEQKVMVSRGLEGIEDESARAFKAKRVSTTILEENDVVKRVKGSGSNVVFNNCILNFDTFQTH